MSIASIVLQKQLAAIDGDQNLDETAVRLSIERVILATNPEICTPCGADDDDGAAWSPDRPSG